MVYLLCVVACYTASVCIAIDLVVLDVFFIYYRGVALVLAITHYALLYCSIYMVLLMLLSL